ncbi:MAG: leucine-rich repeat domain-containing protein [Clostridia bacterium]|nr:leucine-rich repeat domain-containing protein [Clostridia bacterium]
MRRLIPLLLLFCLLPAFAGCAGTEQTSGVVSVSASEAPTAEPTPALTPEPTPIAVKGAVPEDGTLCAVVDAEDFALIEQMEGLQTLDVSGSVCFDAILAYRDAHPDVKVIYTVPVGDAILSPDTVTARVKSLPDPAVLAYLPKLSTLSVEEPMPPETVKAVASALPDAVLSYSVTVAGLTVSDTETALDLSEISPEHAAELAEAIGVLPKITDVELDRADGSSDWTLKDAGVLQSVREDLRVHLTVTVFDRTFSLTDDVVSFSNIPLADRKEELLSVLPALRNVRLLEMEECGFSDEEMAELRAQFPSPKIAWMIHLGEYAFRSDSKMLRLNLYNHHTMLTDENVHPLIYCNEVKYIDLGHNLIQNPYFIAYMPELEVCILAIYQPTDLSAFANCPNLEYAELFHGYITDVSPLANCKHLKHLNLCMNFITDITPLYGLTELERLWISRNPDIPKEQIEKFKELVPNCVVNTTTVDPTDPPWRRDPRRPSGRSARYELLRRQFAYGKMLVYSIVEPDKVR